MKTLITGHRGYVGRRVWDACKNAGCELSGFDVLDGQELTDRGDTGMAMLGGPPDVVIHLAAWCRVGESVQKPLHYARHNVSGLLSLLNALEAARFRGRFVFASTLLARHPESSPYAASKLYGERLTADHARANGHSAVILRIGNVAGGGDRTPGRLLVEAASCLRDRRPFKLRGDSRRDYVHVEDVARAFVLALMAPVGNCETLTLDVGRGDAIRSSQALRAVEKAAGREASILYQASEPWDVRMVAANVVPTLTALGWQPTRTLDDMAREAWETACVR